MGSVLCKPVALADAGDVRHLSVMLLEAFLHVLPDETPEGRIEDNLRYAWFCGPDIAWSSVLHGLLLDTPTSLPPAATRREHAHLVLFDVSLEQWLTSAASTPADGRAPLGLENLSLETPWPSAAGGETELFRRWELAQFRRLADGLLAAGVGVLACQKLVDPWLADYLEGKGVAVLARLSLRHVEHVQRLSGATLVTSLAVLPRSWSDVWGLVGRVESRRLCNRTYTVIHPPVKPAPRARRVSTLLVGAPDEHALSELKHCLPQAAHSLAEVARSGTVFEGAGLTEVYLGDVLAIRARTLLQDDGDSKTAGAVRAISECLLDVASCLTAQSRRPGAAPLLQRSEFLDAARCALRQVTSASAEPLPGGVFEAETPKRSALLGALDLAAVLLRLGGRLDLANEALG